MLLLYSFPLNRSIETYELWDFTVFVGSTLFFSSNCHWNSSIGEGLITSNGIIELLDAGFLGPLV